VAAHFRRALYGPRLAVLFGRQERIGWSSRLLFGIQALQRHIREHLNQFGVGRVRVAMRKESFQFLNFNEECLFSREANFGLGGRNRPGLFWSGCFGRKFGQKAIAVSA